MRALLLRCYPRRWRERYEAEYRALIDEVGWSPAVALDVARGAMRERIRAGRTACHDLAPTARSALTLAILVVALYLFWASWMDLFHEGDTTAEWRCAQVTAVLMAALGARRGWSGGVIDGAAGAIVVLATAVVLAWQLEPVGLSWRDEVWPLQVTMTAYAAFVLVTVARFVGDVRREIRAERLSPEGLAGA